MGWKFLKPTKWKIIISLMGTFLWILRSRYFSSHMLCKLCSEQIAECRFLSKYLIVNYCSCNCITWGDVIINYLIYLIVPFIVIYLIYSVIGLARKK